MYFRSSVRVFNFIYCKKSGRGLPCRNPVIFSSNNWGVLHHLRNGTLGTLLKEQTWYLGKVPHKYPLKWPDIFRKFRNWRYFGVGNVTMAYQNPRSQCHGIAGKSTYPTTWKHWCQMISGGVNPTLSFIISAYLGMEGLWEGLLYSHDEIKHQGAIGRTCWSPQKMIPKPPSPNVFGKTSCLFQFAGCSLFPKQREARPFWI